MATKQKGPDLVDIVKGIGHKAEDYKDLYEEAFVKSLGDAYDTKNKVKKDLRGNDPKKIREAYEKIRDTIYTNSGNRMNPIGVGSGDGAKDPDILDFQMKRLSGLDKNELLGYLLQNGLSMDTSIFKKAMEDPYRELVQGVNNNALGKINPAGLIKKELGLTDTMKYDGKNWVLRDPQGLVERLDTAVNLIEKKRKGIAPGPNELIAFYTNYEG